MIGLKASTRSSSEFSCGLPVLADQSLRGVFRVGFVSQQMEQDHADRVSEVYFSRFGDFDGSIIDPAIIAKRVLRKRAGCYRAMSIKRVIDHLAMERAGRGEDAGVVAEEILQRLPPPTTMPGSRTWPPGWRCGARQPTMAAARARDEPRAGKSSERPGQATASSQVYQTRVSRTFKLWQASASPSRNWKGGLATKTRCWRRSSAHNAPRPPASHSLYRLRQPAWRAAASNTFGPPISKIAGLSCA